MKISIPLVVPVDRLRLWCSNPDRPISSVLGSFHLPLTNSSSNVSYPPRSFLLSFRYDPQNHLRTLYTQFFQVILALLVWPRLLARELVRTIIIQRIILFCITNALRSVFIALWHRWFRLSPIDQYSRLLPLSMSPDRVSVPTGQLKLSPLLLIFGLVSFYLTNYLINVQPF